MSNDSVKLGDDILSLPLSESERIKRESRFLRGTIVQELQNGITGAFTGDNTQLIRIHGMYQQDDRDVRRERQEQKLEPLYSVMLRCRLPGGIITAQQWLAIDQFAHEKTLYGSIRLTTRQTFQFHGICKQQVKEAHQLLHRIGLDALATAGDVNRNVLSTSNPLVSKLHRDVHQWATKISQHLLPKTNAYAEIWLNQKPSEHADVEPTLGALYLPRKFKIALAIPPQNDVDLHANDIGLVAICENEQLVGFNLLAGGGLSMTWGDKTTYPSMANAFGFVPLDKVLDVVTAIVTIQRDWGNRSNRKNARLRYTIARIGHDRFKAEIEQRASYSFLPLRPYQFSERGDRYGWVKGIDELYHLTLFIPNGRILDYPDYPIKRGLAEIARVHQGEFRLTANQNLIVANVPEEQVPQITQLANEYHLLDKTISAQRKNSIACVSLPTCPLAMAEGERVLSSFIKEIEQLLINHHLKHEFIVLCITGCPNNCARAMLAEVGLVGKALGRYNLYLGGNRAGTRIPRLYQENQPVVDIIKQLDVLIGQWALQRHPQEAFGDFVIRAGIIKPVLDPAQDFYLN